MLRINGKKSAKTEIAINSHNDHITYKHESFGWANSKEFKK